MSNDNEKNQIIFKALMNAHLLCKGYRTAVEEVCEALSISIEEVSSAVRYYEIQLKFVE